MIFGLPVSFFALMMMSILGSLLVIIFSFSFAVVLVVCLLNIGLYLCLLRITTNPQLLQVSKVFPKVISAKRSLLLGYDQD